MISPLAVLRLCALGLCAHLLCGCGGTAPPPPPAPEEAEPAEEEQPEVSDLDRPVGELFAASCEHGIPQYTCDECRYEVGVVKASPHLFEEGLLTMAPVQDRTATVPLPLTGEVAYDERRVVEVGTQAEGVIRKVAVIAGDRVTTGQPIAEIESIEVGEAQAAWLEARSLLDLAEKNFERIFTLRDQGVSAEKDLLVARQERDAAQIRAEAAQGRLTRLGVSPAALEGLTAATADGRFTLRAPQAGAVLSMRAVPGDRARADTPLATIGDGAAVWVWADVYERDVPAVREASTRGPIQASITTGSQPGEVYTGTVDFISPVVDPRTRTTRLRVALDNPDGALMAGMFVQVVAHLPGAEHTLAVPREAVMEDEGRSFVFVRHLDDYFVRRPVQIARTAGTWVELAGGLDAGVEVVSKGAFLLKSDVLRSKMGAGCAD